MVVVNNAQCSTAMKIFVLVWVVLSGLLMVATGITHFCTNDFTKYRFPTKKHNNLIKSQGGLSLVFEALVLIVFGIIFVALPFFSFFGKFKFIVTIKVAYNRATLIVFYLVGGLIIFPMCGIMGFLVAILFWLSTLVIIVSFFFSASIVFREDTSSSDGK
ncbi:hypothetical protein EIN_162550 [Entamoeba invadens IP1]|uniref:Uncharacterized protein n=1 Tax=Entamoeba invadens IP1 TaxID=370355 RepID=A0A0A1TYL6_ENTIV|nr:hypothetical protein EIN_162550 [Entamoeba invadens IP1]ELP86611.1 hypothetical protein EIN_162550 [Entamoeba invadens IP1]|eukprot:XP_004185957.1 hypothetical protein EIN_162550 [Entamoeba invadens IP1]